MNDIDHIESKVEFKPEASKLAKSMTSKGPLSEKLKELLRVRFVIMVISIECKNLSKCIQYLYKFPSISTYLKGLVRAFSDDPDDSNRKCYSCSPIVKLSNLTDEGKEALKMLKEEYGAEISERGACVCYDQLSYRHVFEMAIPQALIPTAFEQVGHLIHFNLKEEQLPYKYFIGTVMVDKIQRARTVVNKIGTIENEFRVLPMECIGGEDNYICKVSEQGCKFKLDFSKVYWNSRLSHEHERIVQIAFTGSVVADVFCGVGPFAIPFAARRRCYVHANDLNPYSYEALNTNIALNKVSDLVTSYNLDGRGFIKKVAAFKPNYYIMNLPAIAMSFLDAIAESNAKEWKPIIFLYCFSRGREGDDTAGIQPLRHPWSIEADVVLRIVRVLFGVDISPMLPGSSVAADGSSVEYNGDPKMLEEVAMTLKRKYFGRNIDIHNVRSVSPRKTMCCAQFAFYDRTLAVPEPPEMKHKP